MVANSVDEFPERGPRPVRVSRRQFLQAMGGAAAGLVVVWSSASAASQRLPAVGNGAAATEGRIGDALAAAGMRPSAAVAAQAARRTIPTTLDSWLRVDGGGSVHLFTGKVEYGQGNQTAFAQLVAEELSVPFSSVYLTMGITNETPYDLGTFGSLSMRETGPLVRQAAATMRQWLFELASQELGVPASKLATQDGVIYVAANPRRSVTYGALASSTRAARQVDKNAPLKNPLDYTVVGQSIPRVDIPAKVTGAMKYGYDQIVPGMVHGKLVRPPSVGATLASIDFSAAKTMPGVVGVFRDGDFAGLAAEREDQAEAALAAVKATWHEQKSGVTSDNIFDVILRTADGGTPVKGTSGDPGPALAKAAKTLSLTFRAPYVSHEPIEPMSATVAVKPDGVAAWASTQDPWSLQEQIASALKRPLDQVVVTAMMSGGGFGQKNLTDAGVEAALLAQAFGRPVRRNWTRDEMFQFDQFRPAAQIEIKTGIDRDGNVAGWQYDLYSASYFEPGAKKPSTGLASDSIQVLDVYPTLPNARTIWYQGHGPFPVSPWRGNGSSFNVWAMESAIDELAELAGRNPVAFRRALLRSNPRMLAVMDAVVNMAQWTPAVPPTGQGFGLALHFGRNSYVAQLAQVEVDTTSGAVRVKHVDCAVDCGLAVNPAGVRYQIEGGVVLSTSATMKEEILFANGRVTNNSFAQYAPITMQEAPSVNVTVLEHQTEPMAGIGEPGVPAVPGAIANAIYDAVGVRMRQMPFTPDRVLTAIKSART